MGYISPREARPLPMLDGSMAGRRIHEFPDSESNSAVVTLGGCLRYEARSLSAGVGSSFHHLCDTFFRERVEPDVFRRIYRLERSCQYCLYGHAGEPHVRLAEWMHDALRPDYQPSLADE